MSLTEEAYRERKWGFIPVLRQVLEDKEIPASYYGCSSASDNIFEAFSRLMDISVLLVEHKSHIKERARSLGRVGRESMFEDLRRVEGKLEYVSHFFRETIEQIRTLRAELSNERGTVD
jgi:hypothetical protein